MQKKNRFFFRHAVLPTLFVVEVVSGAVDGERVPLSNQISRNQYPGS